MLCQTEFHEKGWSKTNIRSLQAELQLVVSVISIVSQNKSNCIWSCCNFQDLLAVMKFYHYLCWGGGVITFRTLRYNYNKMANLIFYGLYSHQLKLVVSLTTQVIWRSFVGTAYRGDALQGRCKLYIFSFKKIVGY